MRLTNRGAVLLVFVSFFAGVFVALALHNGYERHSESVVTGSAGVACADAIMADLDAAAEGPEWLDVPAPKWEWVVAACNGEPYTPGVYGGIFVYEDGTYLIEGYGDSWSGRFQ